MLSVGRSRLLTSPLSEPTLEWGRREIAKEERKELIDVSLRLLASHHGTELKLQ
jgi:hypothetical protein